MAIILKPLNPAVLSGESFRIPETETSLRVGRDEGNDLRIDHASVSSMHATLEAGDNDGVEVIDCGSSNGTFVNGIRVERTRLAPGDLLRFASAEFRVLFVEGMSPVPGHVNGSKAPTEKFESETLTACIEALEGELIQVRAELEKRDLDNGNMANTISRFQVSMSGMEARVAELESELAARDRAIEALTVERGIERENRDRLERELLAAAERGERRENEVQRLRSELMQKDRDLASMHYEVSQRDGWLRQWEARQAEMEALCAALQGEVDGLRAALYSERQRADQAEALALERQGKIDSAVNRMSLLNDGLLNDWRWWLAGESHADLPDIDKTEPLPCLLERFEKVRRRLQGHLSDIEPVWKQYGTGAQRELQRRCETLRREQTELGDGIISRQEDLVRLTADLEELRRELDREVRRAQGLSRRGMEVEIPERFEAMVIAKDSEEEIFRSLIDRIEFFDRLLEGYRRNRRLKEVVYELDELRKRLIEILEAHGVAPFEVPEGTLLTLKHRRMVKIVARKGWGTREHSEAPFQPGVVEKIVRPGYQIGSGETAAILRKAEVLIREATQ